MIPRLTILTGNGNVGINQILPDARFQVSNGSVLFDGTIGGTPGQWLGSGGSAVLSELGAGTRMMWIPEKAAFRAGSLDDNSWANDYWNSGNIGSNSIALGANVTATTRASFALGFNTIAGGGGTLHSTSVEGSHCSFALGHDILVSGTDAFSTGYNNTITGPNGVGLGVNVFIGAFQSTGIGANIDNQTNDPDLGGAAVVNSITMGSGIDESNKLTNHTSNSLMVGFNATNPAMFVTGGVSSMGNTSQVGIGLSNPANMLDVKGGIVIGSGSGYAGSAVAPTNGLIVEGKTVIGGTTASSSHLTLSGNGFLLGGTFWTTSDRNLKKEIIPFTDGLATIRHINTVRFHYNGKLGIDSSKEHIGIIAQDIEKIAPYSVREDTLVTRKAITTSAYINTGEIDTNQCGSKMKLKYEPAIIQDVKDIVLSYDPSVIQYITINSIKELDSIISKQDTNFKTMSRQIQTTDSITNVLLIENKTLHDDNIKLKQKLLEFEEASIFSKQQIKDLQDKIQQIQTTCCKNIDLYDDVLLEQNVPNPFSKETIVTYFVPERLSGRVELIIADASGNSIIQCVPVQTNIPSQYTYSTDLQTGVYLYGISLNGQILKSKKMIIIK